MYIRLTIVSVKPKKWHPRSPTYHCIVSLAEPIIRYSLPRDCCLLKCRAVSQERLGPLYLLIIRPLRPQVSVRPAIISFG